MAQFPHIHNGKSVPAHSNEQRHGRGAGHKSADNFHAAVCPEAHDYIDGRKGGWPRDVRQAEWDRAYIATQVWYWTHELIQVRKA